MRRDELRVEQFIAPLAQPRDQMDKCEFAGIGNPAEHAFAEKGSAEGYAVQAADQLPVQPGLYAVGAPHLMQIDIEPHNFVVYPCFRAVLGGFGAQPDDLFKGGVAACFELSAANRPAQPPGNMKLFERQDAALFRVDPVERRIVVPFRHRKQSDRIGPQNNFRIETDH